MRGLTLALDAAANTGTVALLRDGTSVAARAVEMRSDAEEKFLPAILEVVAEGGATLDLLDRIACGDGPGSFTSLRVAGAIAKGFALGLGKPLFAVPSLALIVAGSEATRGPGTRWLATLDAMRGERYLALVIVGEDGAIESVEALGLASAATLSGRAATLGATLIGPDEALSETPHASGLVRCVALVEAAGPVDLASWEPRYGRLAEAQVKWEAAHGRPLG